MLVHTMIFTIVLLIDTCMTQNTALSTITNTDIRSYNWYAEQILSLDDLVII